MSLKLECLPAKAAAMDGENTNGDSMRLKAILVVLIFMIPGCISSEEAINFNGRDLEESETYRFTLEANDGQLWSLDDQEGKTVVLLFMFTRCVDTCPVISANIKWVKEQLTADELEQVSFVSVTMDWRHDSPSELDNWSNDLGYDWPHLTGTHAALNATWTAYGIAPIEYEDDSEEGYDIIHQQPTYILDSDLMGRVVWSQADWPVDLFLEDLRTVMDN